MLKLYNTLTRRKEEFKPLDGNTVRIYSCGPTVYSRAHIGNMRAYIFMDSLRKVLKYNGYSLNHVMNITDVGHLTSDADTGEDKMEKAARESNLDPYEIAARYKAMFLEDIAKLNIEKPEHITPATEHITDMEEYVAKIMENGFAYETSKGIYFDTSRLSTYGELSRVDLEGQMAGARIEVDDEKRNPLDFALWIKAPENHIMKWESRWGLCYPGWHIECSAMSHKYLGDQFDIHTGGVDHIPIHHENEIAQSRGAYGKNPAKFWMHNEFLLIDNGKMSKSLGNVYSISTLEEKGYEPLSYRYLYYTSHYRNKLNFTWEGILGAQVSLNRLREAYRLHQNSSKVLTEEERQEIAALVAKFEEGINDDLNFAKALSATWEIAKYATKSFEIAQTLLKLDEILSLDMAKENLKAATYIEDAATLPSEILNLLIDRKNARSSKDFKLSDEIRDKLLELGYKVIDSKEGQNVIDIKTQEETFYANDRLK